MLEAYTAQIKWENEANFGKTFGFGYVCPKPYLASYFPLVALGFVFGGLSLHFFFVVVFWVLFLMLIFWKFLQCFAF